jgi:hypothetical protein
LAALRREHCTRVFRASCRVLWKSAARAPTLTPDSGAGFEKGGHMTLRHWAASLLAAAGFAMTTAAPSHAQAPSPDDPAWAELTCIYTALMDADDDAYFAVVDAYITEATEGDLFEQAATIIETATVACTEKHDWNADQEEVAITMGVVGTVADAVEGWFIDEGYSDEEIDAIIGLVETISDEEVATFLAEDWRRDEEFLASIEAQLKEVGLDGDTGLMDMGLILLETYLIGMFQAENWVEVSDS